MVYNYLKYLNYRYLGSTTTTVNVEML